MQKTMFLCRLHLLVLVACCFQIQSQESPKPSKAELFELTFKELDTLEVSLDNKGDKKFLFEVLDVHIGKARYLKDTAELIQTYRWRAIKENFLIGLKYADSALFLSEKIIDPKLISYSYLTKGILFYYKNRPQEALQEFIVAYKAAIKANDHEAIADCLNIMATMKGQYGQDEEEAILLHFKALDYLDKHQKEIRDYKISLLYTFDNLARSYTRLKNLDSARIYTRKGLNIALKIGDKETYKDFRVLDAEINYYKGFYSQARDSLRQYLNHPWDDDSRVDILFYLGMIEGFSQNEIKKKHYFKEIDSLLEKNDFPLLDNSKEVFQFLLQEAIASNDQAAERKYVQRLLYYDSLQLATERTIRKMVWKDFDLPKEQSLEHLTDNLQTEISNKEKAIYWFYSICGFLVVLSLIFGFKYVSTQKKLRAVMREEVKPAYTAPRDNAIEEIGIDAEIIQSVLNELNVWEEGGGYLDPKISQNALAKKLHTNSTYLSKIVNTYRQQNFANYLKDLRITYAINYLKEHPDLIEAKSNIQLAEEFGFKSLDVFVRALKGKIGVTPAVFFKQIKKHS